jgi:hypothetical protein
LGSEVVITQSKQYATKLFATEFGQVFYAYQGLVNACGPECHSWHVVLETFDGKFVRTNQAIPVIADREPTFKDACALAEMLAI